MPRTAAPDAASTRRAKVAANVRAWRQRAPYLVPPVSLDAAHARALRGYMKREGLSVSDAIRSAVMLAAATGRPAPKRKPAGTSKRAAKSHQEIRS
jgi:hypothetical protein